MLRKFVRVAIVCCLGSLSAWAAPGTGYWHTSGSKILDANNQQVRIAGINWYGFETTDEVAHGLTTQDYKAILNNIQGNGYNTVRLPFSNQMVETPVVPTAIQYNNATGPINTDLQGLNSLQIMDAIIGYAGQIGLRVILDDHRSEAGNSAEASGLWYTDAYPETAWISDWKALATRYQTNTTVIGVDVRNEPHNATAGGSCWDCGTAANDWHLAAERAGNAVLAINPSLLVFVEGTDAYNNNFYFWGGNLQGVQTSPVVLSVAHQLVYSAHDYGPLESAQSWFNSGTTYDSLVATWTSYWAYISLNGIAPVWVGEFGTLNDDADVQGSTSGSEGQWFSSLVQFFNANPSLNWTYWAINGEDRYGLLDSTYDPTPVNALKQQLLSGIQFSLSGGTPATTPTFTLSQNPATVIAATSNTDLGGSGDTTEVTYAAVISNRTGTDATPASITLTLPASAVVINQASNGSSATCSAASTAYTCNFSTIPVSGTGGLTLTAIYPSANFTFDSNGQASAVVNATASASSQTLTAATVTTTVDKQNQQSGTVESIVATPTPGNSFAYGQQATVNFSLSPPPSSAIPSSQLSAQLDGTQTLTVTSTAANQYQIPVGLLAGGNHSIVIKLASSTSYAAASGTVALAVQKASAAMTLAGTPIVSNYGSAVALVLSVAGPAGSGFAAPTGAVSLAIDTQAPVTASLTSGTATFSAPAGLTAAVHSLNFTYAGDSNYSQQSLAGSMTVKPGSLVATALAASRAIGAANPTFQGTLAGVVNNDDITATYVSQANSLTPVGVYSALPYAITPVLLDPNNRLINYGQQVVDGTLTITPGSVSTTIAWIPPVAIVFGTPLSVAQLDASSTQQGIFTYKPTIGTVLGAGVQTLSVSFLPDGSTTPQTATIPLQVNQANTQTLLQAVNASTAGSISLSATVTGAAGGATSGSVQFLDGSTSLASVAMSAAGVATYSVILSNGPHTLTAVYSGDPNNLGSTSTALLENVNGGLDFQMSANPTSLSLAAGKSQAVTLSVFSTDGFTGTVTFKCTGLPTGSTCTFDPATITGDATTVAQSTVLTIGLPKSNRTRPASTQIAGFLMVPSGLLGVFLLWQRRRFARSLGMCILATLFLVNVSIGCGANTAASNSIAGGSNAVGSYNAVITATSPASVQKLTIPVALTQ